MKNLIFFLFFIFGFNHVSATINASWSQDTIKAANYTIFNKSPKISSLTIKKNKKPGNLILITIGNNGNYMGDNRSTGAGIPGSSKAIDSRDIVAPTFDKIEIFNGSYDEITVEQKSANHNVYTIKEAKFPLKLKMNIGKEFIEFELKEEGKWEIDVNYKNN